MSQHRAAHAWVDEHWWLWRRVGAPPCSAFPPSYPSHEHLGRNGTALQLPFISPLIQPHSLTMFRALSRPGDRAVGGPAEPVLVWERVRLFIGREALSKGTCTWSQGEGHAMTKSEQEGWRHGGGEGGRPSPRKRSTRPASWHPRPQRPDGSLGLLLKSSLKPVSSLRPALPTDPCKTTSPPSARLPGPVCSSFDHRKAQWSPICKTYCDQEPFSLPRRCSEGQEAGSLAAGPQRSPACL